MENANIDFMIHGLFTYRFFGHEVWITTSHVCILIVMLALVIFAFIVNRKMKKATDVPDAFQNVIEVIVEFLDGIVENASLISPERTIVPVENFSIRHRRTASASTPLGLTHMK